MNQIFNCPQLFANQCPKLWQELQSTEDEQRRYCSTCENSVYECRTPDEFVELGSQGKCVALPDHVFEGFFGPRGPLTGPLGMMMGFPTEKGLAIMKKREEERGEWVNAIVKVREESA